MLLLYLPIDIPREYLLLFLWSQMSINCYNNVSSANMYYAITFKFKTLHVQMT